MWSGPRNGKLNDKAHPPIHPVKHVPRDSLSTEEQRIYELLCRHFLACVSKDAVGDETKLEIEMGGETFSAKGIIVRELNYLEVYKYEKWAENDMPQLREG
jgi:DNA topoisomerase-3